MNYRLVIKQLGTVMLLVGACMSTSLIWAFLDWHEIESHQSTLAVVYSVLISIVLGCVCLISQKGKTQQQEMFRKEAIAVVGFSWVICGLLGALPYILSGVFVGIFDGWFDRIAAGIFESVSGFTTTGASIFPSPQDLPRSILFWRSLTHWLGGMGIIVLFVAVLGQIGSGAKFLVSSEVPGPISESIRPRISQTALTLWKIYVSLSIAHVACLMFQGVDLFESLCHTFGTMATGGFSTLNGSVGQYNSLGIEITIIVFMVLAGTNFNLFAAILQGHWKKALRNREFQIYILILVSATGLLMVDLILNRPEIYTASKALRAASFQSVSIMTTTGYGTDDFNLWPSFSRWLLVSLMFVGGSAGSTGGGIKVIRLMLFVRVIFMEIEHMFRPNVVRPLKVGGQVLDDDIRRTISTYVGMVLMIFFVATILLMVLHNEAHVEDPAHHLDLETAFSAVAATLNNIGPGLNMVGATANYAFFTAPAKLMLSLLMILGRLEIMVILCLFAPNFWRKN